VVDEVVAEKAFDGPGVAIVERPLHPGLQVLGLLLGDLVMGHA
jgi:hypothetical protein